MSWKHTYGIPQPEEPPQSNHRSQAQWSAQIQRASTQVQRATKNAHWLKKGDIDRKGRKQPLSNQRLRTMTEHQDEKYDNFKTEMEPYSPSGLDVVKKISGILSNKDNYARNRPSLPDTSPLLMLQTEANGTYQGRATNHKDNSFLGPKGMSKRLSVHEGNIGRDQKVNQKDVSHNRNQAGKRQKTTTGENEMAGHHKSHIISTCSLVAPRQSVTLKSANVEGLSKQKDYTNKHATRKSSAKKGYRRKGSLSDAKKNSLSDGKRRLTNDENDVVDREHSRILHTDKLYHENGLTNEQLVKINQDFKVLAKCLEGLKDIPSQTENEQQQSMSTKEVIKFIKAFNKSEVVQVSKPLSKLIQKMLSSIQSSLGVHQDGQEEQEDQSAPTKGSSGHRNNNRSIAGKSIATHNGNGKQFIGSHTKSLYRQSISPAYSSSSRGKPL